MVRRLSLSLWGREAERAKCYYCGGIISRIPPRPIADAGRKIKKDPETNNMLCARPLVSFLPFGGRQSHRYSAAVKQRPLRVHPIFSATFTFLVPFALHFDTSINTMATSDKYDRQLRLWGASGQRALGETCIVLINATASGTETLKNLGKCIMCFVGTCTRSAFVVLFRRTHSLT